MTLKEAIEILKAGEITPALQVVLDAVQKPNIKELERRISKETDLLKKSVLEAQLNLRIEEIQLENETEALYKQRIEELDLLIEEYAKKVNK